MEARRGGLISIRALFAFFLAVGTLVGGKGAVALAAAPSAISVLQSQATDDFPNGLRFEMVAQGLAQITTVRLAYRISDDPVIFESTAQFSPGNRIDAVRVVDLKQDYIPPGVDLHVRWHVEDISGGSLDTPWATFTVADRRFLWHQNAQGSVVLHWYDGDSQFSDAVLNAAATALTSAQHDAGTTSNVPVNVYLYASDQDFRSALATGSSTWVGGETYPSYHEVVLLAPSNDVAGAERSIAHEMTHVAIDTGDDSPFGPLPTWLDEGLAMNAEGPTDPTFVQALQAAERSNTLLSIQSLSGNFPDAADQATLAYAESDSIVRYFAQSYGKAKIGVLVAGFRRGETSDQAFHQSIGLTTLQFQQAWLASINAAPAAATPGAAVPATSSGSGILRLVAAPVDFVIRIVGQALQFLKSGKGAALVPGSVGA